jgi:uncharacterized protein (DUF302 family)
MTPAMRNGIVDVRSNHSVEQTVERLKTMFGMKGITLFAVIDHSSEAARIGMQMPKTQLVIFGSPKLGTPLMLEAPSIALDLPLKVLVWQDTSGDVWISYNSPQYLAERHGLPAGSNAPLEGVVALAEHAAT